MSQLYSDLTNKFDGTSLDPIRLFKDVDLENKPFVDQFYTYYNSGNFKGIQQLLIDRPQLKNMIITAEAVQYIYDMCISLERFYLSDVENYIMYLVADKGTFSPNVKYTKYNIVSYQTGNLIESFMGTQLDIPLGTLPTNKSYFTPITLSGVTFTPSVSADGIISWTNDKGLPNPTPRDIRGISGSGLTPRGNWNSTYQYHIYDLVSWENKLYYALKDNLNKTPTSNAADWILYLYINSVTGSENSDTIVEADINNTIRVTVKNKFSIIDY